MDFKLGCARKAGVFFEWGRDGLYHWYELFTESDSAYDMIQGKPLFRAISKFAVNIFWEITEIPTVQFRRFMTGAVTFINFLQLQT